MWTRVKGFDTSGSLGPWIVTCDGLNWRGTKISSTLNGESVPMASGTNREHDSRPSGADRRDFVVCHVAAGRRYSDQHVERVRALGTGRRSGGSRGRQRRSAQRCGACVSSAPASCEMYHPIRAAAVRDFVRTAAAPAINRIRVSRTGDRGAACSRGTPMTLSSVVLASELALEEVDDSRMLLFVNLHGE